MTIAKFHMIDVGRKIPTRRLAVAAGSIIVGEAAFVVIKEKRLPKGDPLVLAEIAGIQGAKKTADIIPLCHPLPLEHIEVLLNLDEEHFAINATAFVATTSKTGVEMEALSAVNSALLTVYDLTKMIESNLLITGVRLLLKQGGKQGLWLSPTGVPTWILERASCSTTNKLQGITTAVITLSDRASKGQYEDKSGQWLCESLKTLDSHMVSYSIFPDNAQQLESEILNVIKEYNPQVIFTTGGTGISPRDITPETISKLADKIIPGIGELLRSHGSQYSPYSWGSRSVAAVIQNTLIITLPGSLAAVNEGFMCIKSLIPHLVSMLRGDSHDIV